MAINAHELARFLDLGLARIGCAPTVPTIVRDLSPEVSLVVQLSREDIADITWRLGSVKDSSLGLGLRARRAVETAGAYFVLTVPQTIWMLGALGLDAVTDAA